MGLFDPPLPPLGEHSFSIENKQILPISKPPPLLHGTFLGFLNSPSPYKCLRNTCMVPKPLKPGQQCFTSGWGHTSVDGTPGTILKAVKMKIKEPVHCRKGISIFSIKKRLIK